MAICNYSLAKIILDISDSDRRKDFKNLITYLETRAFPYYENKEENPEKRELHYLYCDSVVLTTQFPEEAIIKIVSPRPSSRDYVKSKIENILDRVTV